MNKIKNIRGMYDIFGEELSRQNFIVDKFSEMMKEHNFSPFSTPIMEYSNIFSRSLGDSSDIVMKEMYTFFDKSNDSVTLRPEGTAGIARAIISNGLTQNLPLKLYYNGPMFRYERPQRGRMRQFHQIGVESYSNDSFFADVEIIYLANLLLKKLDIQDLVTLKINTLGDIQSRKQYLKKLINFFLKNKSKLSEDSFKRLEKNPLRILDSKSEQDKDIIKNAPKIYESLNCDSKDYYKSLKTLISSLNINFQEDPLLVRGLDYYSHTIFEFIENKGKNHAILAGGKYDTLIESLGGPKISGTGWAAGIERLVSLIKNQTYKKYLTILIPLSEDYVPYCYEIRNKIINKKLKCELTTNFNLKKSLKYANKMNAKFAIIIGQDEIDNKRLTIKNLIEGKQFLIKEEELEKYMLNE